MKKALSFLFVLSMAFAAGGPAFAASLKEASVTRTINDVRLLPEGRQPSPAKVGDRVTGSTAVSTGADSRAELEFPDRTLTRLGSNTVFRIDQADRTLNLEKGVLLLQVPKQVGGAKVRTAAVTAAVTGTSLLFEFLVGGFIKIIVLEGLVDVFPTGFPSRFRTLQPGDMIIMKADATEIPLPVQVDLERLKKTSKLLDESEFGPPLNDKQFRDALEDQAGKLKDGELQKTAFQIDGRGTLVTLDRETQLNLFRNFVIRDGQPGGNGPGRNPPGNGPGPNGGGNGNGPPPGPPGGRPPGGSPFRGIPPHFSGRTILNETSTVVTNPHVTAYNIPPGQTVGAVATAEGIVYDGLRDGLLQHLVFGMTNVTSPSLQPEINARGEAALFKFEDLFINGTPDFGSAYLGSGEEFSSTSSIITHLILASQNNIRIGANSQFPDQTIPAEAGGNATPPTEGAPILDLNGSGLDSVVLVSGEGHVFVRGGITGYNQDLALIAQSLFSDIYVENNIDLYSGATVDPHNLALIAGRDVNVTNVAEVSADNVRIEAGRDVNVTASHVTANQHRVDVTAGRHINITNSSTLRALISDPAAFVSLLSHGGDVNVSNSTLEAKDVEIQAALGNINLAGITASTENFKARTFGANGWINIGGNSISASGLLKLYAEGLNGGVRFTDNTTLDSPDIHIAGKTVEISNTKSVEVTRGAPSLKVFTDNPQFNTSGKGSFTTGGSPIGVSHQPFGNRGPF